MLLAFCNPLIDAVANVDRSYLEKWGLKNDDAILADEKYQTLIDEVLKDPKVYTTVGGTGQNTVVMAQWMLQDKGKTGICGSVGSDENRRVLEDIIEKAGVRCLYQIQEGGYTGCCAILVCENNRSIVASVAAASVFDFARWATPNVLEALDEAKAVFLSTFFMRSSAITSVAVAAECNYRNIPLAVNLSSPSAIDSEAWPTLHTIYRVAQIIFGNTTEAFYLGKKFGYVPADAEEKDVDYVTLTEKLANYGNPKRKRLVVTTMGDQPVIACQSGSKPIVRDIKPIGSNEIVDTNGAGDSFAGGFLAYYMQGFGLETCLDAGAYSSWANLQQRGCSVPNFKPSFKP